MLGSSPYCLVASILLAFGIVSAQSTLPTVDLGYEIHRALFLNVRGLKEISLRPLADCYRQLAAITISPISDMLSLPLVI